VFFQSEYRHPENSSKAMEVPSWEEVARRCIDFCPANIDIVEVIERVGKG
jgi:hypothetical protein